MAAGPTNVKADEIWGSLSVGLDKILSSTDKVSAANYMELYSYVYNFCTSTSTNEDPSILGNRGRNSTANQGGAEFVGSELYKRLNEFLIAHVRKLRSNVTETHGMELLQKYSDIWKKFQFSANVINGIFSYLNRHWIKRELDEGKREIYEIFSLCVYRWEKELFVFVDEPLTTAILQLLLSERNGESITTSLVSDVLQSYLEMGINDNEDVNTHHVPVQRPKKRSLNVYKTYFENKFLAQTEEYYIGEAQQFLAANSVVEYLKKVETRIKEERERVERYLDNSTLPSLMKTMDKVLISDYLDRFRTEFNIMLQNNQTEDLARMFSLCERVEGTLDVLRKIMEGHIEQKGRQALLAVGGEPIDSKVYVNAILTVHKQFGTLVANAFRNEAGFVQAMDKAFTSFINRNPITEKVTARSPELLARYSDLLLRKSPKSPPEAEIEENLNQVMIVFKYIEDKDVFQKFYSKLLAKRLVHEVSANEDFESQMLAKLKHMCGFEYTSKLQRMYQDNTVSKELSVKFRTHAKDKSLNLNNVDLSVMVLAQGVWPFSYVDTCTIPKVLEAALTEFEKFYIGQHTGRKLTYLHNMCRGEVSCNAFSRKYGFIANTQQMAILMMYNDADMYTLQQIVDTLSLKKESLPAILTSMLKVELLKIEGGVVTPATPLESELHLNKDFSSRKLKVDLSKAVTRTEVRKEQIDIQKDLDEDRRMVIQAAIVRVMKMRKKFGHSPLMTEVIKQLSVRFSPNIKMIKKCIDILIEKEYLARVNGDRDTYEYLS
uniref:CULLIN_2 domain-containing protein n=1 Tax=Panagrellus redivivus TaxID=6233 RepID=A0A7E4UQK4_PANRE